MSEEFSGVLTLRADDRETVEEGVELIASWGDPKSIAQALVPMPAEWVGPDGSFSGKAVDWAYKHWGCKGCWLDEDMWWEETEPGDESNEWWACWDITSVNGVPRPLLEALSKRLPNLQIGYFLEGNDEEYELILVNGDVDHEDGSYGGEDEDDEDEDEEDEEEEEEDDDDDDEEEDDD